MANRKWQMAKVKKRPNSKIETGNWKSKTQTQYPRSPRGSLLYVLRFAFCVLPFVLLFEFCHLACSFVLSTYFCHLPFAVCHLNCSSFSRSAYVDYTLP